MAAKQITLDQILTPDQIEAAFAICEAEQSPNQRLVAEVVNPAMAEINRKSGQENAPSYIAYAIEYVYNQMYPK